MLKPALKRSFAISFLTLWCTVAAFAQTGAPSWLESDSAQAIARRTASDFSLTMAQGDSILKSMYGIGDEQIRRYIDEKYIETKTIDGTEMMYRKSPRNLGLVCPEIRGAWGGRGADADSMRLSIVDSIVAASSGEGDTPSTYRVHYRFTINVLYNDLFKGDTLRVWMPVPMETPRQKNVQILSSFPEDYILSSPEQSVHHTLYFSQAVTEGETTHFEYEGSYDVSPRYFSPEYIRENIKPYDRESELYKQYTAMQAPHIVEIPLAREIVGEETDPYLQSEMVYEYIQKNFPWAGAREYSTIECIPEYVVSEGHGDCGQVALLYISMMRTLGVPARWESGWMLHPGEKNLHDWAETYYEGIGWVPVDVSFGRYPGSENPAVAKFYSTGIDQYRFATNCGIGGKLYPEKRFVRSETVDFQMGEVECSKGNLFYPGWDQHMEIISIEKIK